MAAYRSETAEVGNCVARHLSGFNGISRWIGTAPIPAWSKSRLTPAARDHHPRWVLGECQTQILRTSIDSINQAATASVKAMCELWKLGTISAARTPTSVPRHDNGGPQPLSPTSLRSARRSWRRSLVSPRSPRRSAMHDLQQSLERFLGEGRIEIDSNIVERAIRPPTITGTTSLFAGSESGGNTWATIATLLQTAKINDVDPLDWLTEPLVGTANG